jgi:hypothetical protein
MQNCELHPDCECQCEGSHIDMQQKVNPNKNKCTVCTGDTSNNIWFVPRAPGFPGRCILDELTYDDVYTVLQRNPNASRDLQRVTSQPTLLRLAREVPLVKDPIEDDQAAADRINANTLPFYTIMRGNIDGSVMGKGR